MSTSAQFDKAVQVVGSLPKDGPVQPSQTDQLTFYGLCVRDKEEERKGKRGEMLAMDAALRMMNTHTRFFGNPQLQAGDGRRCQHVAPGHDGLHRQSQVGRLEEKRGRVRRRRKGQVRRDTAVGECYCRRWKGGKP